MCDGKIKEPFKVGIMCDRNHKRAFQVGIVCDVHKSL